MSECLYTQISGQPTTWRQKLGYLKACMRLSMGCGPIPDPGPEAPGRTAFERKLEAYRVATVWTVIALYWSMLLSLYRDITITDVPAGYYACMGLRYAFNLIAFIVLNVAAWTQSPKTAIHAVCVAWVSMMLPLLVLAAVPFSYVILGDVFVRGAGDRIETIKGVEQIQGAVFVNELSAIVNTTLLLAFYMRGLSRGVGNFLGTLDRLGEGASTKVTYFFLQLMAHVPGIASSYTIGQAYALVDYMGPFYIIMWWVLSLFQYCGKKAIIAGRVLMVTLVVAAAARMIAILPIAMLIESVLNYIGVVDFSTIATWLLMLIIDNAFTWFSLAKLTELVVLFVHSGLLDGESELERAVRDQSLSVEFSQINMA